MHRWIVRDRFQNEIYLTQERWEHILEGHDELVGRLDDLLDTVRYGQRRQEALDPQRYRYYRKYNDLPYGFHHLVAIVIFTLTPAGVTNNFIVTAWGAYIYPKR
jgi:hypothetical protein